MTQTINIVKSLRVENEEGLSGGLAPEVEAVDILDQEISAASEEDTGMGRFFARQMRALSLLSDVPAEAMFLGDRIPITGVTAVAGAAEAFFTHAGDMTGIIFPGDVIRIENHGTAANDGIYLVEIVVAGQIDLDGGEVLVTDAVASGTFAKVMSLQAYPWSYTIVNALAGPPPTLEFTGDLTDEFEDGDFIIIQESTDTPPSKDAIYEIATVVYLAPTTTITLTADKTLEDANNDGQFHKAMPFFKLIANQPLLWTRDGGCANPLQPVTQLYQALQSAVGFGLVNVPGAVLSNFQGRVAKNADLP